MGLPTDQTLSYNTNDQDKQKIGRRIDILAKIMIWLSVIWFALFGLQLILNQSGITAFSSTRTPYLDVIMMTIQLLIGFGLIKRQKSAYYIFRICGILALISALLTASLMLTGLFLTLPILLSLLSVGSFTTVLVLLSVASVVLTYVFWIYGLFITNSKTARSLFS